MGQGVFHVFESGIYLVCQFLGAGIGLFGHSDNHGLFGVVRGYARLGTLAAGFNVGDVAEQHG